MKEQVDNCAKSATPNITLPFKACVNLAFPQPAAFSINTCITSSIDPMVESGLKQSGYKSVDKCIDTGAKIIIDKTIDSSVNSAKSSTITVYDYIQSKFY